ADRGAAHGTHRDRGALPPRPRARAGPPVRRGAASRPVARGACAAVRARLRVRPTSASRRDLDAGRLARALVALLPSWARARTPVAERSHARAQPVDRDPVRPWHEPSDLTYVDFVRSAMYQFDISARHLVGHAQRPGDDARTIGRTRAEIGRA